MPSRRLNGLLVAIAACGLLILAGPVGCSRSDSPSSEKTPTQPSSPAEPESQPQPTEPPMISPPGKPAPKESAPDVEPSQAETTVELPLKKESAQELFTVDTFTFKFHKQSKAEMCDDWDYFIYNGTMSFSGKIASATPINFTAADFELSLSLPFGVYYDIPARRERETLEGEQIETTFQRKGSGQIFAMNDYRLEDDDLVYRNDEDMTGYYENHGPLMDAVFDFEKGMFVIAIKRIELDAEDMEPGEELDFQFTFPRTDPEQGDFDQEFTWTYRGSAISAESFEYTADCP